MKLGKINPLGFILLLFNLTYTYTYTYADVEQASTNEFPATVGTAPSSEHDGFVLEWEDGNWSDFVRQLSDATTNFQFDSVDLFGMFKSDGSADSDSASQIAAHSYHRTDVSRNSAGSAGSAELANKTEEVAEDKDWRSERKWWQRGTPVQ